jgi:hypothetical protein
MQQGCEIDIIMEDSGWVLRRLRDGVIRDHSPTSCWAEHKCEARESVVHGRDRAVYGWYPRDNAYFGACCYCGAGCPEELKGIYLMLNLDVLSKWSPKPWARRGQRECMGGKDSG